MSMIVLPPSTELPPLPPILSPVRRARVFTHRSLFARPTHVFEDAPEDPSPDNEMLEHLGDQVLGLVVTDLIQDMHPHLRVGPSTKMRALIVGNQTLATVAMRYRLHDELRLHQSQSVTLKASMNVRADVFESYVGGLYKDQGLPVVERWLRALFRPYVTEAYRIIRGQHGLSDFPDTPPPKLSPVPLASATFFGTPSPPVVEFPSPPGTPPSPQPSSLASTPTSTSTLVSSRPTSETSMIGHLGLFNQRLQQKNLSVEWVFADSVGEGTKATPVWVARAMVEGREWGHGRGSTKKAAKNEAAKSGLRHLDVDVDMY